MRVLYLDIDTLRPDRLSCYGYHRNTSPNIDRICKNAVRFDNCFVSDAPCLPSRASAWLGRFGIHTGIVNHGGVNADPMPEGRGRGFKQSADRAGFCRVIEESGLHTVSVSPFAERHSAWWFYQGFKEMYNTGKSGRERADEIVPLALDWLDRNKARDDWFLHVNVWDPHGPFDAPMEHGEPFAGQPGPEWITEEIVAHHRSLYGPHSPRELNHLYPIDWFKDLPRYRLKELHDLNDYHTWNNGYDTGIWHADLWVGKILDKLEEQGVLDDTAIIVTSDHGENLGELGVYGDHQTADQITCRIPYLIKWPGVTDGGRVDKAFHYKTDLMATVLEMLNQKVPRAWDGVGFAAALRDGREDGRSEVIVSNNAWSCQRGVRWDNWMAIRTYHTGYKPFPEYMLFDIDNDPHETVNLAKERPEVLNEGIRRLEKWTSEMLEESDAPIDPLWTVMQEGGPHHANDNAEDTRKFLAWLRESDRGCYADWLEANKGKPIPDGAEWAAAPLAGQGLLKAVPEKCG